MFEAFRYRGVPCLLYQVDNIEYTQNKDFRVTYLKPVESFMMFEENPKAKLKKLQWFIEEETEALVGYFVAFDTNKEPIKILRETRVDIEYQVLTGVSVQRFLLKDLRANDINQFSYIAKLVPYRESIDSIEDGIKNTIRHGSF